MRYLFIESRSERESPDVAALFDLAGLLRQAGHDVTLFLVQNAVATAGCALALTELMRRGVEIWADEPSLVDRGLGPVPRPDGIRPSGMPDLVRLLMSPDVVSAWH
jgi:predicted peroxiredoxin